MTPYRKILTCTTIALMVTLLILITMSPYKYSPTYQKNAIVSQIKIHAPYGKIYNYLGKSSNAKTWSSFVSDIQPLNSDQIEDGEIGSLRRCYGKQEGIVWDEEITEVKPGKSRTLKIINAQGFPIMVDDLVTKQIYIPIDSQSTSLSLSLFQKSRNYTMLDALKMKLGAYMVDHIFMENLKNIKYYNEFSKDQ